MMGNKRAWSVAVLLGAVLSLVLSACGSDNISGEATETGAADGTNEEMSGDASDEESGAGGDGDAGELVISSFGGAWGQAIQLGLVDTFEAETGVDVTLLPNQDTAKSTAAIESGNPPPEDIVDTNQSTALAMDRDGHVAPIDYGLFDEDLLDNIPEYAKLDYALGWGQFAIGICYDKTAFPDDGPQPQGWVDFWDTESFPGNRGMLSWPAEPQPEFGLMADGVPADELYPLDLDRAFNKLEEIQPQIPQFPDSPAVLGQMLVDGQVVMEACFTHRVQTLVDGGLSNIGISFDQARLQTEYFYVWEDAPNKDNAMKFLAFILEARPQSAWAQIGNTGPLNPDAFEAIPEDVRDTLPTSPSHESLWPKDDEWYSAENEEGITNQELVVQRWDEFISR